MIFVLSERITFWNIIFFFFQIVFIFEKKWFILFCLNWLLLKDCNRLRKIHLANLRHDFCQHNIFSFALPLQSRILF